MDPVSLLSALLDEERRLRTLAEGEVRTYRTTLTRLALRLAPAAFDARRREAPQCFDRFSPGQWETFFAGVETEKERPQQHGKQEETRGGNVQPSAVRQQPQATGSEPRAASHEPRATSHEQRATSQEQPATGSQQGRTQASFVAASQPPMANSRQASAVSHQPRQSPSFDANGQPPTANGQSPPAESRPLKADGFVLPPSPPARFRALFDNWEREGLALYLLATTGWSLRYAIDEALALAVGIGPGSGSVKRLFARLEKMGLVVSQVYDVGGVRAAILLLSERGRQVAQGCGFVPVPSEWELLLQAHGGERQARHAALCCAFAYQVRKRGWGVELCPPAAGPAQPDLRIQRGETAHYVEVEGESGESDRRMRKWRNLSDLQGYVALCASSSGVRERLVLEAQAASRHGVATDLPALIKGQDEGEGLWVERWGRGANGG
jgi:hypothetical protein